MARLAFLGLGQGASQEGLVLGEHLGDIAGAHALLEAIHQGVVRIELQRGCQCSRGLAHQANDLREMRVDHGEIRLAARLAPHFLAGGVGACLRLDEVRRHRGGARVGMAHQAEVRRAPRVRISCRLGRIKIFADNGSDQQRM